MLWLINWMIGYKMTLGTDIGIGILIAIAIAIGAGIGIFTLLQVNMCLVINSGTARAEARRRWIKPSADPTPGGDRDSRWLRHRRDCLAS